MKATEVWRDAGELWEVVSSRLVVVRLKWVCAKQRKHGGSRETCDISKVPRDDVEGSDDLWQGIIGKYCLSECNLAGEKFLEFCASNQLMVDAYNNKEIDFVVMRSGQRGCCRDVEVIQVDIQGEEEEVRIGRSWRGFLKICRFAVWRRSGIL